MSAAALADAGELGAACTAAQLQAERHFGDAPPPLWEPAAAAGTPWPLQRWRWAGLGAVALVGALAAWTLMGRPAEAAAPVVPPDPWAQDSGAGDLADPEPPPPAPTAQAQRPPALAVSRSGRLWQLEAQGASRLDAARQLAELSGSSLHGPLELLAQARPLDLHWQGRTLAQAWEQVLGTDLNYALQCRRDHCEAWIVAAAAPGGMPARPVPFSEGDAAPSLLAMDVDEVRDSRDSRDTNPTGDAGASHH